MFFKSNDAFSNPEYMSYDEIIKLSNEYKRISNTKQIMNIGHPPSKPPPPPPKTPPIIKSRARRHLAPPSSLYQNVKNSPSLIDTSSIMLSEISSDSSSSNATMIIRKSPLQSIVSVNEDDENHISSIIYNDSKSISPPIKLVNKPCIPRAVNRLSLLNEQNNQNNKIKRRSEPLKSKRIGSLSPIMTSSRADLNSLLREQKKRTNIFKDIEEEMNYSLEPTIINSPPSPPPLIIKNYIFSISKNKIKSNDNEGNRFANLNYFTAKINSNTNSSVEDDIFISDESSDSLCCPILLQPPSPFKSPKQSCIDKKKNDNINIIKKVSFMLNEDKKKSANHQVLSCISSASSSCSSLSSTGSISLTHGQVQEMNLIKEKIFSKIFANEDYFVGDLINKIESASASSIQSSCASSTSSSSSGYKSNQSANISNNKITNEPNAKLTQNQSSLELKKFIDRNRDRLDRLKVKRNHLIGFC